MALLEGVEDIKLNPEQADAVGLLGVDYGPAVEPDPHRDGRWRIARRGGHRTGHIDGGCRSQAWSQDPDRQGAMVATEPETGLVTAAVLLPTPLTVADSDCGSLPTNQAGCRNRRRTPPHRVRCGGWLRIGHTPVPSGGRGSISEDGAVRVPPGTPNAPAAPPSKRVPTAGRCTTSKRGRTITVPNTTTVEAGVGQRRNAGHLPELSSGIAWPPAAKP